MRRMRVLRLAALELRRYRRGHLARAAVIAIILLPLLYGTVYLAAFWNPYNNLSGLPVALVNQDVPVTGPSQDGRPGEQIAAGQQLQDTLLQGKDFDWHVVTAEEADAGLENGSYYFELTVPATFSQSIASLGSVDPVQAEFRITTNEANNYITSLIAKEAGAQIQAGLAQQVIQQFVSTTLDGIVTIRSSLQQAASGASQLHDGTKQLKGGSSKLSGGAGQVAAGNAILAQAADTARGYAQLAETEMAKLVSDLQAQAAKNPDSKLAKALLNGAQLVSARVDSVADQIVTATLQVDQLSDGSNQVAAGAKQLAAGAKKLNAGARQLSAGLADGVGQIPDWTNAQAAGIAAAAADPIGVVLINENDPGSYGAGFAPYFLSMSLWVGLIIVFMILSPLPTRVMMSSRVSAWSATLIGYLPVIAINIAQVAVLLTVIRFGLNITPVYLFGLLGFLILVGAVYAAILQLLNAALGAAGRIVALVLLMLQLCSSGGTYPIETSPEFFRTISPFLPMTYVVRGVRHLINGGSLTVTYQCCFILAGIGLAAFLLAVLVASRKRSLSMSDLKPELSM